VRKFKDGLFYFIVTVLATLPILVLVLLMGYVFQNGFPFLYGQLTGIYNYANFDRQKIMAMLVSTLMIVGLTLVFIVPFAIFTAIYLSEYARASKWATLVIFCVDLLASLPSIVYGLFGMLVFVRLAGFGMSILAGALTLSLMLLPLLMKQTLQTLKSVPNTLREGSLALGTTSYETTRRLVLPHGSNGILVGILLVIGKILGESAALLFTMGTFVRMPISRETGLLSVFESGTTLTIRALIEFKEYGNLDAAMAIGIVAVSVSVGLNVLSKLLMHKKKS
jgi:phosphate transport system permease protein